MTLRALLQRLEWASNLDSGGWGASEACCPLCHGTSDAGHAPDCELAAALREAPHVKVTEVVGYMAMLDDAWRDPAIIEDGPHGRCPWQMFLPRQSTPVLPVGDHTHRDKGPRGRFRVTVEFWPEEKKP